MNILNGKELATTLKAEIKSDVENWVNQGNRRPHLAAILVGDNPASMSYVRNKVRSCDQSGVESTLVKLEKTISEKELLDHVDKLNNDDNIDGYIVQLPLPDHIDEDKILLAIKPSKDVDGFHPINFGRMAQGLPSYLPATPKGIVTMLERYDVETSGKNVVVLGRSNIVGTPISILLSRKTKMGNATVTLTHSRTKDIAKFLREADIIIAALGIPHYLKSDMVKKGCVVIDVGINRIEDNSRKSGYRLVGDVDFDKVADKCELITPVPGGVGPMTVVSLIQNTVSAAKKEIYN